MSHSQIPPKISNKIHNETRDRFKSRGHRCMDGLELLLGDLRPFFESRHYHDEFSLLTGEIIQIGEEFSIQLKEFLNRVGGAS